ncbi:MAG: AAA family ATPase [Vicinamibacterales bacterium]
MSTAPILITGASGSGTTTLGKALAEKLGAQHIDADDYYWLPTDPPYRDKRPADERLKLILNALSATPSSVVSGSVMGYGAKLEDSFTLIVFLLVETDVRLARLRARELRNLGSVDEAFLTWASQYEDGPPEGRSRARHEAWLASRSCPVLRLEGSGSVEDHLDEVVSRL